MDAATESGRNSASKHNHHHPYTRFGLSVESDLMRDGTAEPFSRDQTVRRERGQENTHFSFSADHEQDWQPYPVDPYSITRYTR